jgi:Zn-dependent M28 family amino/carboxypeptidase
MAAEHYNLLHRLLVPPDSAEATAVEIEVDVRARFHDETTSAWNTLAEIPGSDPAAGVVMLGAHLDSWHAGTGATDDGAGCAVVMEAVRILEAIGARPRRSIRVALWTGEEQGLLGSRAYVERHFADVSYTEVDGPSWLRSPVGRPVPKPEHERLAAYFNLDNGSGRIRGVYTQGNAGVLPIFEAWLAPFHDLGADTLTQRDTGGTDHLGFDAVGLPGFQFIQDRLDYTTRTHHTHVDTFDHARAADLMQASVIMASFAWHAAERAEKLPREPIPEHPAPPEKKAGDGEATSAAR